MIKGEGRPSGAAPLSFPASLSGIGPWPLQMPAAPADR